MITEGVVLSLLGAAGGLALGWIGVRTLVALSSRQLPGIAETSLNPAVLLFTLAIAVLTGLVFGVVPAVSVIRGNTASLLKDDATRGSASRTTTFVRSTLVIAETALALMLLVGAGLLIKSFGRLLDVNPGFSSERVLTAGIALPASRYPDAATRTVFWTRLLEKARVIPGVTAAGVTSNLPLSGNVSSGSYGIVGYTPGPSEAAPHGRQEVVGGDYFRAMQIPVVQGRVFADSDTADSQRVVVIDQYLVDRYFPHRNPLGQEIQRGQGPQGRYTIVGVVATINAIDLAQPVNKERLYYPIAQQPRPGMTLVLKSALEPSQLVAQLRSALQAIDPEQPLANVRTMDEWVSRSLEGRRTPMVLFVLFGVVALLLSAIGIYGVLAFNVAQRVREFGIRQALGANSQSILSLVFKQGLTTAGTGLVIGLLASYGLSRYLETLLFGVQARDWMVFSIVTVLLFAVAALACYIPARRATRIDPIVALRV
jgi:putative ABC transport system permease protein